MSKKLIDILLWEEGFYPFSLKFDLTKASNKHKDEIEKVEIDATSLSVLKYSKFFNIYFIDICNALKKTLEKSVLDKSNFTELLIADLNRTEVLISEDTKRARLKNKSLDTNDFSNIYIHKPEFQNNSESSWALIDSAIDTTILNLNYLNYIKFETNEKSTEEIEQVDVIKNLTFIGSSFNAIKQAYDRIIWRADTIELEDGDLKLKSDPNHLMLDNVALTRLTRNIRSNFDELLYSTNSDKNLISYYHKTRKFQEILSIDSNQNDLVINYKNKNSKPSNSYYALVAPLITYYPFYSSQKIREFDDLTILDLVNLFSILQDFVELLPLPDYEDTAIKDLTKFRLFNPKVNKASLIKHFKIITKYTEKQIIIFLNLLIQQGIKHNLYRYPVYEEGNDLYFSHSNIKRANMLYLIDRWLESGNCDLSERGFKFEDYIKDFLKNESLNEFAQFNLIEKSNFFFINSDNTRLEEEIDLVIITETTIIIGEIKCITYPLESNDFYNSYQTIKKAKNQVLRKVKFLEDNWAHFENILGKQGERTIEKIIVVNFPHFAGRNIDEIPIADFYLFLSYFKSGRFSSAKIEKGKAPIFSYIPYYESFESFEKNFTRFFSNPIPIIDLINRQEIEEYEVSLNGTEPKVIAQRVIYNPKSY